MVLPVITVSVPVFRTRWSDKLSLLCQVSFLTQILFLTVTKVPDFFSKYETPGEIPVSKGGEGSIISVL